jgi:hypothetical protein
VIVNGTWQQQTAALGANFRKILGTQDPTFNNGASVNSVTLQPHDAIILLRTGPAPTPTRTATPVGPTSTPTRTPTRTATPAVPTPTPTPAGTADLRVAAMQDPPASVSAGTTLEVADTTKNFGPGAAGPSTTRYYLSLDTARGAGDLLLTPSRAVPALPAGEQSWGPVTVTIPGSTPSATYYLLACADDANSIPETDEGNNCNQEGPIALSGPPLESQDSDGDGCADGEEMGPVETLGGQRDPLNPWDFFDVPVGIPPAKDKIIDLDDTFGVIAKFGAVCGDPLPSAPPYGQAYDRSQPTPNPWSTQAPDCVIDLNEFFWSLDSFGHTCFPPP